MQRVKIKLTKSSIVNGASRPAGWEGEVSSRVAKTLILMGKAKSLETETMELKMSVELTPELQKKIDEIEREYEQKLLAHEQAKAECLLDIATLSLKELREKYKVEES